MTSWESSYGAWVIHETKGVVGGSKWAKWAFGGGDNFEVRVGGGTGYPLPHIITIPLWITRAFGWMGLTARKIKHWISGHGNHGRWILTHQRLYNFNILPEYTC